MLNTTGTGRSRSASAKGWAKAIVPSPVSITRLRPACVPTQIAPSGALPQRAHQIARQAARRVGGVAEMPQLAGRRVEQVKAVAGADPDAAAADLRSSACTVGWER